MSPIIASYAYLGSPIDICGNPSIIIANNDGIKVDFLSATYSSGSITVALPDKSIAIKGTYTLTAVFTQPGSYSFNLGITLKIYDVCDDSTFPAAPVLSPTTEHYYTN